MAPPGAPVTAPRPADPPLAGRPSTSVVDHLVALVSGSSPRLLLVVGPPGAGKSSLLRAMIARMREPTMFVAYRVLTPPPNAGDPGNPMVSLLLVDPWAIEGTGGTLAGTAAAVPVSFAPVGATPADQYPPELADAIQRLATAGGGCIFVDSWDRGSEDLFRGHAATGALSTQLGASTRTLQDRLGELPVHLVLSLATENLEGMETLADGVVRLGHEPTDCGVVRTLDVEKLRGGDLATGRHVVSLEGGEFYTPPPASSASWIPDRPPDPDDGDPREGAWPGSRAFARAFGRLRDRGLTGVELDELTPNQFVEVLAYPMVAAAVLAGNRVVWIPPASTSPAEVLDVLGPQLPPAALADHLRILSAGGADPSLGALHRVVLPVRREMRTGGDTRTADAPPIEPLFPDAFKFLQETAGDRRALFLLSLDGLRALSTQSGNVYAESTIPLVVSRYARLPRFHGIGFGRRVDPFSQALLPGVEQHLRVLHLHGQTLIAGIRPETPPYLLDRSDPSTPYRLLSAS